MSSTLANPIGVHALVWVGGTTPAVDLAIWRNLWDDGVDLATHAHRFIVDGMSAAARRHS